MKYYSVIKLLPILLIVFTAPIFSEEAQTQSTPKDSVATATVNQEAVKLFIDKIKVEGQLEKPQAVFILPGQTPDIDDIQIERSFMKEIFRPVEKRYTFETKYKPEYSKKRKDIIEW